MSGAILPFDAVCTVSPAINKLQKVNKQVKENYSWIRDQKKL